MTTHQIHYGKKFYEDKKTGYWISTTCPKIRAHVWVWKYHHNLVPKGWHVHHRDGNKSNNHIENLTIMSVSDHVKHHFSEDENRKIKAREWCEKIRPQTKAWHASPEGKAWHKLHAIKSNFGYGEFIKYNCQQCSQEYQSRLKGEGTTKFCSNNCKSAWRRANKLDDVLKKCPICYKEFLINRYRKTLTCSRQRLEGEPSAHTNQETIP